MSHLSITQRRNADVVVLDLQGDIKLGEGSSEFRAALRRLAGEGEKKVLLNLAKVSHIDSSGLGELVAGFTSIQKAGGELKIVHLTDRVTELMTITKLLTVFDVFDDETEAVASFGPASVAAEGDDAVTGKLEMKA